MEGRFVVWFVGRFVGWSVGWLVGRFVGRSVGRSVRWLVACFNLDELLIVLIDSSQL